MRWIAALLLASVAGALTGAADPGILLVLDRERFVIESRDLRDDQRGPELRVVIGSPAHPTPAGNFAIEQVVRNPRWTPGTIARGRGARQIPASDDGPLGVAKLTFGPEGVALHGGARRVLLGKPVSLGCVRALDADLLALLDWLDAAGALGKQRPGDGGEIKQRFERPARIVVR